MRVRQRLWWSQGQAQCILCRPPFTISGTVLKKSDDLVILGVTFDSKINFEKHLRSVSRAASQRLGILRNSWRVFYDRSLLGRGFRGFVLPVSEYCSAVWCSAADTHFKLLDCAVSGAWSLTNGMYKIRCYLMHLVNGVRPDHRCHCRLHAVPWCHISILMRRLTAEPHSTAGLLFHSQYRSGTILPTTYSMVWDWRVSRAGPMLFIGKSCSIPTIVFYYFPFIFFLSIGWYCGAGVFGLIGITLSQPCTADLF